MRKLLISVSLLLCSFAFTQVVQHSVQPKETIYGISKQYGITQQALKDANPFLNSRGLQIGDVLVIPTTKKVSEDLPLVSDYEDENFYYRVIKPKETLYRLSKIYGVSQAAIKSLNPFIEERGLQVGDVVRIAKKNSNTKSDGVVSTPAKEGVYEVKKGDTVYSIAKENGLSSADIYATNKEVQVKGLKAGTFINIPKKKGVTIERNWFKYKVQKDETIFAIMRKYNVSLDDLLKNNPQLNNGLKEGMIISVPMERGAKIVQAPEEIEEEKQGEKYQDIPTTSLDAKKDNEINIALILPFYLNKLNDYTGQRKVAEEFYMGVQLALDNLIKQGKKVNLKVLDGQNDKAVISDFIKSPSIGKYDAIIGPLFQDKLEFVANRLEDKNIPVFSPIVNTDKLQKYSNLYLSNPKDEYAADILIDDIVKKYKGQVVKILTTVDERSKAVYISNGLSSKLKNANISIIYDPESLRLTKSLQENTEVYQPEIAVLASENNALGDRFVNEIITQKPEYISGFSLNFVPALDIFDVNNKKNIEALKKIGFEYTSTRMINSFGSSEKKILSQFEDKYCQKPTKYMAMGYDLMYDVVDRMNNSGYISPSDAERSETRLSSKFAYQTSNEGKAKVNKEIRVIRLN